MHLLSLLRGFHGLVAEVWGRMPGSTEREDKSTAALSLFEGERAAV